MRKHKVELQAGLEKVSNTHTHEGSHFLEPGPGFHVSKILKCVFSKD